MSLELEEKLIDFEVRLSFQEQTIDQLNDAILHQSKIIDKLINSVDFLSNKMQSIGNGQEDVFDQKPPHY